MTTDTRTTSLHMAHWGAYEAETEGGALTAVRGASFDPEPSPILGNIASSAHHPTRVAQPMIRAGWLDGGPGPTERRGAEPFVPVSWDTLTELLAAELRRVYRDHGAEAVFAGSYGWASAGRLHQAQTLLHRFLNLLGGYVDSRNSYSLGAGEVILPRVFVNANDIMNRGTTWNVMAEHTDIWLAFGGMPLKNTNVSPGGVSRHTVPDHIRRMGARGVEFMLFSPIRDDLPPEANARWYPVTPGTDVALMLGIAHTLVAAGLHDREFLAKYCTGFDRFERYLRGLDDGQPKDAAWAAGICGIPAAEIEALARKLPGKRVMVTTTWSLQRTEHGEQKPWMGVVLAAMLGQIGLPGGGFGFGYGSAASVGGPVRAVGTPRMSPGRNPVEAFIPVARFADTLLNPGATFRYDGGEYTYPDIKLVYWAGGNPFHHHQDLPKLRRALARADTIVVHDPYWTGMARHADIVVPSTITLERNDIGTPPNDGSIYAMKQVLAPYDRSRNDFETYADLSAALDLGEAFTEGRDEMGWLRHMYAGFEEHCRARNLGVPDFDEFWAQGRIELPEIDRIVYLEGFRADPNANPLRTPSGKIEVFSGEIDGFGLEDCPGHPAWLEPGEWLGGPRAKDFPLLLIANNPKTRLHSQLDVGAHSIASKVQGREPIRLNPEDAAVRGIADGDVVRAYNDRGSFLAGAVLSDQLRRDVVQVSTGAWYDPLDPADPNSMCVHGNPNALTLDAGASSLTQSSTGQQVLVQVEKWRAPLPPIRVHEPPPMEVREGV